MSKLHYWRLSVLALCAALLTVLRSAPAGADESSGNDFILEYTLHLDQPYTGIAIDDPQHPLVLAREALAAWSRAHHGSPIAHC